jgi:hypothetical protein
MHKLKATAATAGLAAALLGVSAGNAFAQVQPDNYAPTAADVVGTGSDTIQGVDAAFAKAAFNAHFKVRGGATGNSFLISWDAFGTAPNPGSSATITLHNNQVVNRADTAGSGKGITTLINNPNVDYARSSRARAASDPASISFVPFAGDAVAVGVTPLPSGRKPSALTTAQLTQIYSATAPLTWGDLGTVPGLTAADASTPIKSILPQSSSGTRSFFLGAIGVTTPGAGVFANGTLNSAPVEENNGKPIQTAGIQGAVFPYSVAVALSQVLHHDANGYTAGQTTGNLSFPTLDGILPYKADSGTYVINTAIPAQYQRLVFHVVRGNAAIPADLQGFFGPSGAICTYGTPLIKQYGFVPVPSLCGTVQ